MAMETDDQFYARRAAEERRAADRATSPEAKACHLELALRYSAKLSQQERIMVAVND